MVISTLLKNSELLMLNSSYYKSSLFSADKINKEIDSRYTKTETSINNINTIIHKNLNNIHTFIKFENYKCNRN